MKKQPLNNYGKYSGIAFKMVITVIAGVFLGKYLDDNYGGEKPYYTIGLTIFSIFAAMYFLFKDVKRFNKDDEERE